MEIPSRKALRKKAKKGFHGYPVATVAYYGPTDASATKLVVSIVASEHAEPEPMRKWFSDSDLRTDATVLAEVVEFIRSNGAVSVALMEQIFGCPHEEGIDYPEGEPCPRCPFWRNRDRFAGAKPTHRGHGGGSMH